MSRQKIVYLTIDDSPSLNFSEKIDFLYANNIPAIIFCIGKAMKKYSNDVIDAIRKGYIIGNHSYSHPRFSKISFSEAKFEIHTTDQIIDDLYARANKTRPAKLFRFPYGDKGWAKDFNFRLKRFMPSSSKNFMKNLASSKHKHKIQQYLKELNYNHPDFGITYPFYHDLNLNADYDMFWTFDFCEYKIKSFPEIVSLINQKENWDVINSTKCRMGSFSDNSSNDILLLHDHADTSHLFYAIINHCKKLDLNFKIVP